MYIITCYIYRCVYVYIDSQSFCMHADHIKFKLIYIMKYCNSYHVFTYYNNNNYSIQQAYKFFSLLLGSSMMYLASGESNFLYTDLVCISFVKKSSSP